jgi:hypothetical protein
MSAPPWLKVDVKPTPTDQRAAQLIADNLAGGLIHPGDGNGQKPVAIPLPPFRTAGMPPALTQHLTTTARMLGEAIVHLLRRHGIELIDAAELEKLRALDPKQPPPKTVTVECPHGHPLLEIVPRPTIRLRSTQLRSLISAARCKH